jgi:anti-sigma regulatory factor (Ser/Thr protein kinase)
MSLDDAQRTHSQSYPCHRSAPSAARRFVTGVLAGSECAELSEDAAIVTAELANNAVLHANSEFTVAVTRRRGAVRIAVRDASPRSPVLQPLDRERVTGRGLVLVSSVADRWGVDALDDGKVVWAELG